MNNVILITSICCFSINYAISQEPETPVLNSNRIGFTESSRAVHKGGFLLEAGLGINHSQFKVYPDYKSTQRYLTIPRLNIGYGITKFMEVRVGGDYRSFQGSSTSGFSDYREVANLDIGLKFNLSKQKGMLPQSAITILEQYYMTNKEGSSFKTKAIFSWSYKLGKRFDLAGNISFQRSFSSNNMDMGLSLRAGYNFTEKFGIFTELYTGYNYQLSMLNIGAWYKVSPRFLLSANIGTNAYYKREWQNLQNNFTFTLGASFILNNPKNKTKRNLKRVKR